MTAQDERNNILSACDEAHKAGLTRKRIAEEIGIPSRTLQNWASSETPNEDQRPHASRPKPSNALSEEERQIVLQTANLPENASLPPAQIVANLADQGIYIASESTF